MTAVVRYATKGDVDSLRIQVGLLWIAFGLAVAVVAIGFARSEKR